MAVALLASIFSGGALAADSLNTHPDYPFNGPPPDGAPALGQIIIGDTAATSKIYEITENMDVDGTGGLPENTVIGIDIKGAGGGSGLIVGSAVTGTGAGNWSGTLTTGSMDMEGTGTTSIFPGDGSFPTSVAGYAVLGIDSGNTLNVVATITVNGSPTTGTLTVGEHSWVAVGYDLASGLDSTGSLTAKALSLNGADSEIWVGNAGNTISVNQQFGISEGILRISAMGEVNAGNLSASGANSIISMNGGIIASMGEGVSLSSGASLLATGTGNYVNAKLNNGTGFVHVETGADLSVSGKLTNSSNDSFNGHLYGLLVEGTLDATGGFENAGSGTTAIEGTLNSSSVTVNGGKLAVSGKLDGTGVGTFSQTGGETTVDGTMSNFGTLDVDGGTFTLSGTLTAAAIVQDGGSIDLRGTVANTGMTVYTGGGNLRLGSAMTLGSLDVGGTANVTVGASVETDLAMGGGTMNLATGGTLEVRSAPGSVRGRWNMDGGSVEFNDAVAFSGGTILANRANAAGRDIVMNGHALTISSAVDTTGSGMTIVMDDGATTLGNFTLNGRYSVGHNGTGVNIITVTGAGDFTVDQGADVELSEGAIREFNSSGSDLLILATDSVNGVMSGSGITESTSMRYRYDVLDPEGDGTYGLYVTEVAALTHDEQLRRLRNSWLGWTPAGSDPGRQLNGSFVNAVIGGNAIALGLPGAAANYAGLNDFGKFNADQLAAIMNPQGGLRAGYDALMLYNGAGLTMANEAVVNANRHLLRRAGDRMGVLRREVIVDEAEIAGSSGAREDDEIIYGDPNASRIWAEGVYHSDAAGLNDGFAGYEYRGAGLMIGADKRAGKVWYGGALSYVGGDYADMAALSSASDISSYSALLYLGGQGENGLYANGTLGYAYSDVGLSDRRYLLAGGAGGTGTNTADYGTHSFMIAGEAGKDFRLGEYLTVTPSTGISYVRSAGNAHSQWFRADGGGGAQTIVADAVTGSSLSVPLNLAVSVDILGNDESLLSLTGKAGYAYEFLNGAAKGKIRYSGLGGALNPVDAAGRDQGRHSWNLGLSARYLYQNAESGMGYDYVGRDKYNSHNLTISAGLNF